MPLRARTLGELLGRSRDVKCATLGEILGHDVNFATLGEILKADFDESPSTLGALMKVQTLGDIMKDADFEGKHPRADDGKFGEGGGGASSGAGAATKEKPKTGDSRFHKPSGNVFAEADVPCSASCRRGGH